MVDCGVFYDVFCVGIVCDDGVLVKFCFGVMVMLFEEGVEGVWCLLLDGMCFVG